MINLLKKVNLFSLREISKADINLVLDTFKVGEVPNILEGFEEEEREAFSETILKTPADFIGEEFTSDDIQVIAVPSSVCPFGPTIFGEDNDESYNSDNALSIVTYIKSPEYFQFFTTYPSVLGYIRNVGEEGDAGVDVFNAIGRIGVEFSYPEDDLNALSEFDEIDPSKTSSNLIAFETIYPETDEEKEEFSEELKKLCKELDLFFHFGGSDELFQEYKQYPQFLNEKLQGYLTLRYNLKILSEIYEEDESQEFRIVEDMIDLASSIFIPMFNEDKMGEVKLREWPLFMNIFREFIMDEQQGVIMKQNLLERLQYVNEWIENYEDFFEKEFLKGIVERLEKQQQEGERVLDDLDKENIEKLKELAIWE